MTRKSNWDELLATFMLQRHHQPFKWGSNDCVTFAFDWINVCTGIDYGEGYRGTYKDKLGAAKVLAKHNVGDAETLVETFSNTFFREQPLLMTMRGDIVSGNRGEEGDVAVGVCVGAMVAFVGKHGIEHVPLMECRRSWHIT